MSKKSYLIAAVVAVGGIAAATQGLHMARSHLAYSQAGWHVANNTSIAVLDAYEGSQLAFLKGVTDVHNESGADRIRLPFLGEHKFMPAYPQHYEAGRDFQAQHNLPAKAIKSGYAHVVQTTQHIRTVAETITTAVQDGAGLDAFDASAVSNSLVTLAFADAVSEVHQIDPRLLSSLEDMVATTAPEITDQLKPVMDDFKTIMTLKFDQFTQGNNQAVAMLVNEINAIPATSWVNPDVRRQPAITNQVPVLDVDAYKANPQVATIHYETPENF